MRESIVRRGREAARRWHQQMPRFFYWVVVIACGIGGTAFAINSGVPMLGGTLHEWWTDIYSYVVGGCIGVVFVCKFTVAGGYKDIDPDKLTGRTVLDHDTDVVDGVPPGNGEGGSDNRKV